jgi:methionyl-tRNA synthetase
MGHAYEAVITDCLARHHRLGGKAVRMISGTDEHGQKMVQTAAKEGIDVQALADRNAPVFQQMLAALNCQVDGFTRTTEGRHKAIVQDIWRKMAARGDIYKGRYEGFYSVRDEAFYAEDELIEGEGGQKLSPQGTPVEWTVEESYFFRLSAHQDKLLALYESQPDFIAPAFKRNEVLSFVKSGLRDLSISRATLKWGVPVPDDPEHVMYVWVDALTTYITAARDGAGHDWWPADLHVIGKDILRFHAVYWPAFLMSAGVPLPKQLGVHGFVLNRGEKMSKSLGNVVDPFDLVQAVGSDSFRYFFLKEISFGQDGGYSPEAIATRCNADLANSFGNLVQRIFAFIVKNLEGQVPALVDLAEADEDLLAKVREACAKRLPDTLDRLEIHLGLEAWVQAVYACNQYVDVQAPWSLRKTDPARMNVVLATLVQAIHDLAIAAQSFIPIGTSKVLDMLGIAADARRYADIGIALSPMQLAQPAPLYSRIEASDVGG